MKRIAYIIILLSALLCASLAFDPFAEDEYPIEGAWRRVECTYSKELIGMELYVAGDSATILYTPSNAFNFLPGQNKWIVIRHKDVNKYTARDMVRSSYRGEFMGFAKGNIEIISMDTLILSDSVNWQMFERIPLVAENIEEAGIKSEQ